MATECYAMVRGSAIRVTGLTPQGSVPEPYLSAVSRSVAQVTINEVSESGATELVKTEEDEGRLLLVDAAQMIRHEVDISFLRCDPGVLNIVVGANTVIKASRTGFGFGSFGSGPFGSGGVEADTIVGFDMNTRIPAKAFALEVWSQLDRSRCAGGARQYGYTLFPYLLGGYLTGFRFDGGLVSFNVVGAKSRNSPRWGTGPYDLEGKHQRLLDSVSRNLSFKTLLTTLPPPAQTDGAQEGTDVIDGGTAASAGTTDILDGETVTTSPWVIDGGRAV